MRIFSSLVFGAVTATDCPSGDFCVISCNDAANNQATAMTISVDQGYLEGHHNALTGTFNCNGSDCVKTIQGADLFLNVTDTNYIYLEHEMVTADEAVANSNVYFAGQTTTFKCKYPRSVSVDGSFIAPDPTDPDPYVGDGAFHFDMQIDVSAGRTQLNITEEHGIPSLVANVETCAITYANMPGSTIYPVRYLASWGDTAVCKDNRVDTTCVHADGGAIIDWRTFHFNDPTASSFSQSQDVTCALEVSNTLNVITPDDCACTISEQECGPGTLSAWSAWSTCSASCDGGVQERTRTCSNNNCNGALTEQQPCNEDACPAAGPCAIIWQHNFAGDSYEVQVGDLDLCINNHHNLVNGITSVEVYPGCTLVGYADCGLTGATDTFDDDWHNRDNIIRAPIGNDNMSSMTCTCA